MSQFVDDIISQYLERSRDARKAFLNDPLYSMQVKWTQQTLGAVDAAMESEGIGEEARKRVLLAVLHGGYAPGESG